MQIVIKSRKLYGPVNIGSELYYPLNMGNYYISKYGNVMKIIKDDNYNIKSSERIYDKIDNNGIHTVELNINNNIETYDIAKLVYKLFKNQDWDVSRLEIGYKDGNPDNLYIDNLELDQNKWFTGKNPSVIIQEKDTGNTYTFKSYRELDLMLGNTAKAKNGLKTLKTKKFKEKYEVLWRKK